MKTLHVPLATAQTSRGVAIAPRPPPVSIQRRAMGRCARVLLVLSAALACRDESAPTGPVLNETPQRAITSVIRVDLGTLGGASSFATDIDNKGTVVGWSLNAGGVSRAFRWSDEEGMTDLGTLPGDDWSRAISINVNTEILGVSGDSESGAVTPVVWTLTAGVQALPIPLLPSASFGEPTDFNQDRVVVGWDVAGLQHAWSWTEAGGKQDITARVPGGGSEGIASQINASGIVAGTNKASVCTSAVPECWRAFVWSVASGYLDIGTPSGDANVAVTGLGLNNARTVVGWTMAPATGMRAFRWSGETGFVALITPSYPAYAMAVNSSAIAVGAAWNAASGAMQPAAWTQNADLIPLNSDSPNPGVAVAINDASAAVGWSSSDCCGADTRATLWRIVTGSGVRVTALTRGVAPSPQSVVSRGRTACLANATVLVSRSALFACMTADTVGQ